MLTRRQGPDNRGIGDGDSMIVDDAIPNGPTKQEPTIDIIGFGFGPSRYA